MKKVLQFVAATVVALLTLQPLLAAPPCMSAVIASRAADCPMANAAPDCPMAQSSAMPGCTSGCCKFVHRRTVVPAAILTTPKAKMSRGVVAVSMPLVEVSKVLPNRVSRSAPAASPPRYKLFCVFRI